MITKDGKDLPILAITPENYLVPKGEERLYHVKMEVKSFDQHTGARLSHPFIQKYSRVDFEGGMMSILRQQGYDMEILHDPKAWEAEHAAELRRTKAEAEAEAKKKAEEEREALKAAMKAEILAEMKAEAEAKAKAEAEAKTKGKGKGKKDEAPAEEVKPEEGTSPAPATDEEPDLS